MIHQKVGEQNVSYNSSTSNSFAVISDLQKVNCQSSYYSVGYGVTTLKIENKKLFNNALHEK